MNPEEKKAYHRAYYKANKEKWRANYQEKREELNAYGRSYRNRMRRKAISSYGNKCACCGETEYLFLELDHINGGGRKHRLKIGDSSYSIVRWAGRNNYPKDIIQILCSNCNMGKARNGGICPHQLSREE